MIKVAFFAEILERDFDGSTRTMHHIIDRIDNSKYNYTFFCSKAPKEKGSREYHELPYILVPFNSKYRFANVLFVKRNIKKILANLKPDVIHIASPSFLGQYAAKYGERHGIPVLSIYHTHYSSYVRYYTKNIPVLTDLAKAYVNRRLKRFYNRCDTILLPTRSIRTSLIQNGIKRSNIQIWERGIDANFFHPSKRNELHIQEITDNVWPTILFASRLVWEKNLQILIDVYNIIDKQKIKLNIIIAGDGHAKAQMQKQMPKAHFLGHLNHDELSKIYASCDYFFFPSTSETYGNVLLEAMASELPCIVADGGANVDIIRQGINGFLCQIGTPRDYLRKLDILHQQPTVRKLIVSNARAYAEERDWHTLVERYFSHIEDLYDEPLYEYPKEIIFRKPNIELAI